MNKTINKTAKNITKHSITNVNATIPYTAAF